MAQGRGKTHLDILRMIAIWMVVYAHTWKMGYTLFTEKLDSRFFWIYISFSILIRSALPIFWMISGALLLGKEETLKEVFKKRIVKFIVILISFSIMQYFYLFFKQEVVNISIGNFLEKFYSDCMAIAYWYLYAYLGFLLMLPFIRKIAKGMQNVEYVYLFVLYIFFTGIIPLFEYFILGNRVHLTSYFQIPIMTTSCIVFSLLGYYIETKKKEFQINELLVWSVISIMCLILIAYLTKQKCIWEQDWKDTHVDVFFDYFSLIPAYTLYGWVKWFCTKKDFGDKFKAILAAFGKCTLGIMLIENILRDVLIGWYTNNILFAFYKVTEIVLVGFVIVYLAKKVVALLGVLAKGKVKIE